MCCKSDSLAFAAAQCARASGKCKVAESYANAGKHVQFADVHGCLNGMNDMDTDKLHPTENGYEKMGKFWAGIVDDYVAASAPVVTTTTTVTTTSTTTTTTTTATTTQESTTQPDEKRIAGDVNLDGYVTVADAVAILQYIGNKDKYPLSSTAKANADVSGNGDGVTPNDALTIQKVDAGLIDISQLRSA